MPAPVHTEIAKAKINLNLKILAKREDGFHAMETRMAPISLADVLEFYPANEYLLECNVDDVPLDETNLVTKAVRIFQRETAKDCAWRVALKKSVPHGAGLGGGSADAAAVLRGLNQLEKTKISNETLAEWCAEIGSDVPFFIYESVCDCTGRGEVVTPVSWEHSVRALLLKPSFGVSTPTAYRDWQDSEEIPSVDYALQKFEWGEMFNDLERPVFAKHRFLAEMKMWLLEQPETTGAMMSGSGSTMIAVLKNDLTDKQEQSLYTRAKQELDPTLWGEVVNLG